MSKIAEKKFSRNPDIIDSEIDDEIVMMDVERGNYFGLNVVGSSIWQSLEELQTVESLVDIIIEEYDVSREKCKKDITPFIEQMLKSKLLVEADS